MTERPRSSLFPSDKKNFFTGFIDNYSSQKEKALPVKTSKPNFVTLFMYFGNSLLDQLRNFLVYYGNKPGKHFARNLREFGVARSEELEVNQ